MDSNDSIPDQRQSSLCKDPPFSAPDMPTASSGPSPSSDGEELATSTPRPAHPVRSLSPPLREEEGDTSRIASAPENDDLHAAAIPASSHLDSTDGHSGTLPPSGTDIQMVDTFSIDVDQQQPSLQELRERIIETRGARAQLPAGWEEQPPHPTEGEMHHKPTETASSSSSDSSSEDSDSSSSEDSSDEGDEKDKVEMASDYDSDDSARPEKGTGEARQGPTTKSELPLSKAAELFRKLPFNEVPMEQLGDLRLLGKVHGNVQEVLVISQAEERQGATQATYPNPSFGARVIGGSSNERQGPILDAGSLVATKEGKVIGLIFETFGSLLSPLYSVLLPSAAQASLHPAGQHIFYLPSHSTILRPAELRANQGKASDASNVNDEEAGLDEMDFSDDEEEAEFKRRLKASKKKAHSRDTDGSPNDRREDGQSSGRGGAAGRGRGRGRGAGRGRGGRAEGPVSANMPIAPLPKRPNWQLDDPTTATSSSLSYDEDSSHGTSVAGRSRPRPYEATMFAPPPKSAGLPAIPKLLAEVTDSASSAVHSETKEGPLGRIAHPLPPPPASAANVSSEDIAGAKLPGQPPSHGTSQPAPASQLQQPPVQYTHPQSHGISRAGPPAHQLPVPPPGAHINPLFAHQWAPQQQHFPHLHPTQQFGGQQPYGYPPGAYPPYQQGWSTPQQQYQVGANGGHPPRPSTLPHPHRSEPNQPTYWPQQPSSHQQYYPHAHPYSANSYPQPYEAQSSAAHWTSGQTPSYPPQHPTVGPPESAPSYDPNEAGMDLPK